MIPLAMLSISLLVMLWSRKTEYPFPLFVSLLLAVQLLLLAFQVARYIWFVATQL
jgi:hypothetical protein